MEVHEIRSNAYVSNSEAAMFLSCSQNWLDKDRMNHPPKIPFFKLGTRIKYKIGDLEAVCRTMDIV